MTDTLEAPAAHGAADPAAAQVDAAIDGLLASHDPKQLSYAVFRGAQFDAGLAWVHFDEGHGGLGVSPKLQRRVEERLRAAGAKPQKPVTFFMHLAGPTIHTHGSEDVKRRFLRPMFTGEELWCQLFSEPGAGSDFAGLATKAVADGEEWVVNGQKVWNTLAHLGDFGMLVTRTNPEVPKHRGLTYFALDMKSPGVEVRPLRQITGEAEFNEVYMTDVRVPDANRVGDVGDGWRVSLTTLMNERNAIGAGGAGPPKRGSGPISVLVKLWNQREEADRDDVTRDRLTKLWTRAEVLRLTNMRAGANRRKGNPGPEMSIAKLAFAELNQALMTFAVDMMGPDGLIGYDYTFRRPGDLSVDGADGGVQHGFLRVRANSIEGGTSEIMRNILGEQVLGLPGEPRVDKDVPWVEVPRN
ncbi:acyl-CoA dehydrogenase family protein [Candidatus Poriferisodalis sp.]|uniref:acyl-CoA dehydrogenase family protein n=1 Tax=Candidatus Poriferisodalis sp. TaxID=3101277 RepID=UPI003B524F07